MAEENKLLNEVAIAAGSEQERWNCENDNYLEYSCSVNSVRHILSKPRTYYTYDVNGKRITPPRQRNKNGGVPSSMLPNPSNYIIAIIAIIAII